MSGEPLGAETQPPAAMSPALSSPPPRARAAHAPTWLTTALLLLLLTAVALVVAPTIPRIGKPGPDELYYLSYARALAEQGPGALPGLFRAYVEESRHWLFPNPLRISYLGTAALWIRVAGASTRSLGYLSLACHLLALVVAYRLVARRLGAPRALLTTVLLAFSPPWLGMARRALQESFVTLAMLLALAAFLDAIDDPGSRRRAALFGVALGFALLAKESVVLLVPPLLVALAVDRRPGANTRLVRVGGAIAAALVACAAVWLAAAGGFERLVQLIEIIVRSPASNPYALRFGGGPWYRYLIDLLALSVGPTLLGLGGAALVLERGARGPGGRLQLLLALVAAVLLVEYAFLTKNLRYGLLLELPLRVLAVEALWRLLPARSAAARIGGCAAIVALLAAVDVATFRELFVEGGLYDPVSAPILQLRGLVPPS